MFSFFYNFFLALFLVFKFFCNFKKYKKTFLKRLFFEKFNIPKGKKVFWVHAVSVGEIKAVSEMLLKIKKEDIFLIVSTITETGLKEAKKSISFANKHIYLPIDFSFIMKRVLGFVKPDLVFIVESDFWYHFLKYAKYEKAKIALINGKLSHKSFKRYKKFPFFAKKIFSNFDILCVQNEEYRSLFKNLGFSSEVTGNLKFSKKEKVLSKEELEKWKNLFQIQSQDFIITIASTHEGEEELLLEEIFKIKRALKILLAPRHPERFSKVEKLLVSKSIEYSLYSNPSEKEKKVVLVNTMGFLNVCYQLSDLAIVGGSFIKKVGGHNILEPVFFDLPVFFGPFMFSQKDLKREVLRFNCGKEVFLKNIEGEIENYFKVRNEMQKNCEKLKNEFFYALEKTLLSLKKLF
jgi:3-deoxy-D-manno-octulosonic-acid transferase